MSGVFSNTLTGMFSGFNAQYLSFNGAPSFMASIVKDSAQCQGVDHQPDDETMVKVWASGFPKVDGCWLKTADKEEDATYVECTENGKKMKLKAWWDEEDKALKMRFINHLQDEGYQLRKLTDNDTMHHVATMTKPDGSSATFEQVLKRKK